MRSYFSADDLFRLSDNRVPLASEYALRGLLTPLESLFPTSRVPSNEQEAVQFITTPDRHPTQPLLSEMKNDWFEWLLWELEMRLRLASRYIAFRSNIANERRGWFRRPPPLILFLREFRDIRYFDDLGVQMLVNYEADSMLRDRIERMFPTYPVLWVANPRDDLSRCFLDSTFSQVINNNSIAYVASADWLGCVRILARAADVIVMSNTKAEGGVGQEVTMLKECGAIDKTYFSDPAGVGLPSKRLKSVDDLKPTSLRRARCGCHRKILEVPLMRHWAGPESLEYARQYAGAVDNCAGNCQDLGRSVGHDVFAAVFMAMIALLIFRGELRTAASIQRTLATILLSQPEDFHPYDILTVGALVKSAQWYDTWGDVYCIAHCMRFVGSQDGDTAL